MLQGKIVILRPMERSDVPRLWEFAQDLDLGLMTGADGRPMSLAAVDRIYDERWVDVRGDAVRWGIEVHDQLIGGVELSHIDWRNRSADLGVWIGDRTYRQRGCGADAMRLALNYAFKLLGLNRIHYMIPAHNLAAIQTYTKLGFSEEGRLRQAIYRDGLYHDLIILGILREDWHDDTPLHESMRPIAGA